MRNNKYTYTTTLRVIRRLGVGIESFATMRYVNPTSLMNGNTTMLLSLWMHIAEQEPQKDPYKDPYRIHLGIHIGSV